MKPVWTDYEINQIRHAIGLITIDDLVLLTGRTKDSIVTMIRKIKAENNEKN